MIILRLLLKLVSAIFGLYLMLAGVLLIIAASQNSPDSHRALGIISGCFLAASVPFLVAVASTNKARMIAAILLAPASIAFLFLAFTPALQPDTRIVGIATVQVVAIAFATLLFARIADAARTSKLRVGT